jgi:Cd2+/Zn2+-exporting ATPase
LGYLASVERESDHPLAKAVLKEIETTFSPVESTEVIKGGGIRPAIMDIESPLAMSP